MSRYRWWVISALGIVAIVASLVLITRGVYPVLTATATDVATWAPDYSFTPEFSPADFEAALSRNRAAWESKHISHYIISIDLSGMGYDRTPWIVEVKADNVVSIVYMNGRVLSPSEIGNYEDISKQFFNVTALFSFVEQAYQDQPPMLRVEYDSNFGYPKSIYVDPWVEPCCQDYWINIGDLRILP